MLPGFQLNNGYAPVEGAKGVPVNVVLAQANTPVRVQLQIEETQGVIGIVQAAWIDNSLNPELLIVSIAITGQIIRMPRFSQGVVPLYSILPFDALFSSAQAEITIPIILLNMPQPYAVWTAV